MMGCDPVSAHLNKGINHMVKGRQEYRDGK